MSPLSFWSLLYGRGAERRGVPKREKEEKGREKSKMKRMEKIERKNCQISPPPAEKKKTLYLRKEETKTRFCALTCKEENT